MIRRTSLSAAALFEAQLLHETPPTRRSTQRQWRIARERAVRAGEGRGELEGEAMEPRTSSMPALEADFGVEPAGAFA